MRLKILHPHHWIWHHSKGPCRGVKPENEIRHMMIGKKDITGILIVESLENPKINLLKLICKFSSHWIYYEDRKISCVPI